MSGSSEKIDDIYNLLSEILEYNNKYYITSWCIVIVEDTYEMIKKYYRKDIFVYNCYNYCLYVLNYIHKSTTKKYRLNHKLYNDYMSILQSYVLSKHEVKKNRKSN